jgi:hypothetical protein
LDSVCARRPVEAAITGDLAGAEVVVVLTFEVELRFLNSGNFGFGFGADTLIGAVPKNDMSVVVALGGAAGLADAD